jgi:pantothenate kinase-related protein Tda10
MTDLFARIKMNTELAAKEANNVSSFRSRDEKKALKRAKEAEREFRKSKGLEVDTFWSKLSKLFKKKD